MGVGDVVVWISCRQRSWLYMLDQMSLQGWVLGGRKLEEGAEGQLGWMDAVLMRGRQEGRDGGGAALA